MIIKCRAVKLDEYERGAIMTAMMELRNKYIAEETPIDFLNEVILKLCED